jgi:hypothetical protein
VSEDFFAERTKSTSFAGEYPIVWEGEILALEKKQATDYTSGEPRNWPDGNPMMQGWITLQTKVRDDDDDDGRRVMVLDSKNKREAVQNAVKVTGQKIAVGGHLTVEWYGVDPNGKNPQNLPKLYRATYQPPDILSVQTAPPTTAVSAPTATGSTVGDNGASSANPADLIKLAQNGIPTAGLDADQIALIAATL